MQINFFQQGGVRIDAVDCHRLHPRSHILTAASNLDDSSRPPLERNRNPDLRRSSVRGIGGAEATLVDEGRPIAVECRRHHHPSRHRTPAPCHFASSFDVDVNADRRLGSDFTSRISSHPTIRLVGPPRPATGRDRTFLQSCYVVPQPADHDVARILLALV